MQVIVVAAEGGQTTWNPNSRTHAPIRTSHYYIWKRNNAKTVVHEMPEEEDSGGKGKAGKAEKKAKAARIRQAEVADRKTQNSFLFLRLEAKARQEAKTKVAKAQDKTEQGREDATEKEDEDYTEAGEEDKGRVQEVKTTSLWKDLQLLKDNDYKVADADRQRWHKVRHTHEHMI
jgi:ABC-type Fe3+-citrate transport system substrate-binding protein